MLLRFQIVISDMRYDHVNDIRMFLNSLPATLMYPEAGVTDTKPAMAPDTIPGRLTREKGSFMETWE